MLKKTNAYKHNCWLGWRLEVSRLQASVLCFDDVNYVGRFKQKILSEASSFLTVFVLGIVIKKGFAYHRLAEFGI